MDPPEVLASHLSPEALERLVERIDLLLGTRQGEDDCVANVKGEVARIASVADAIRSAREGLETALTSKNTVLLGTVTDADTGLANGVDFGTLLRIETNEILEGNSPAEALYFFRPGAVVPWRGDELCISSEDVPAVERGDKVLVAFDQYPPDSPLSGIGLYLNWEATTLIDATRGRPNFPSFRQDLPSEVVSATSYGLLHWARALLRSPPQGAAR